MTTELRYGCDTSKLPPELVGCFVQLAHDESAQAVVAAAQRERHGGLRSWSFRQLRRVVSDYQAYGLLGMYRMHLLSTAQWRELLRQPESVPARGLLLDIGAGRGDVTRSLLPLFENCHATEAAGSLRRGLARLPLQVMPWDLCQAPVPAGHRYDLIACLNVIDRVSHPKTLLRHARAALSPEGRLVVAVPLPLRPHVDLGRVTVDQEQPLPDTRGDWEASVTQLWRELLHPMGFVPERLSRVPYLSQGDDHFALHVLDDVVLVCRPG